MKKILLVFGLLSLSACTTMPSQGYGNQYRPIIDTQGKDAGQLEVDLQQCQQYANQTMSAAQAAAAGALFGAILNMAVNKAVLGSGGNRAGAAGAIVGGLGGAAAGETNQRDIIKRCMAGRGYNVLQ